MDSGSKVLFVFWEGFLDVAPTLIEFIRFLSARKISIDLVISNRGGSEIADTFDKRVVRIIKIDPDRPVDKWLEAAINHRVTWRLVPTLARMLSDRLFGESLDRFADKAGRLAGQYNHAFCVDATGLYAYHRSGIRSSSLVNISFEVIDLEFGEHGSTVKRIKEVEREMLVNDVKHIIIQDKYRGELLQQTIGACLNNKFLFLPNSVTKGVAQRRKSRYFHRKFGLTPETRIVLSAGMISEAVLSLDIARSLGSWNPAHPTKTVFHQRPPAIKNAPYLRQIKEQSRGNLILSLEPVPYDQLDDLFAGADIGLAIYSDSYGDDFRVIGSASGKLYQYIKQGIPVIVSDLPGLAGHGSTL